MTAQRYSVAVPFSSTGFQMGASVGGPGVSLCTAGDVLLDSVGVMDIQSKGAFMGQTNATMAMLSASIQKIHSQGKVEIFAGGGKAPAVCGLSAPADPVDAGPPGAITEKITDAATAALSVTSAGFGLSDAWSAGGVGGKVIAVAVAGVAAVGAAKAAAGAAGAGGGGGADIEERAKANIKMIAGKKISGVAPMMICAKTLGKWEVKALLSVDFTTTLFTNFALAKFEVKALNAFSTSSVMWEVKGDVATDVKTKNFEGKAVKITMNGDTKVTKVMDVIKKTTCRDDLQVERNAMMTGKLNVKGKTEVKGTLTIKKNTKIVSTTTVDGDVKTKTVEFKSRVTFGM